MIYLLFLLCAPASAQVVSTNTSMVQQLNVLQLQQQMKAIQSGRPVLTSTPTFQSGMAVSGPLSVTGVSTFAASVLLQGAIGTTFATAIASAAVTTNVAITQTIAGGAAPGWVAVGGSTITYTPLGSYIRACFHGTIENESANGPCLWVPLVDGAVPSPYDTSHDAVLVVSYTGGYPAQANDCIPLKVTPNVSHSIAMVVHIGAAGITCYVGSHNVTYANSITEYFHVEPDL